jgi:phosphohistidine phosphatase SixA
MAIVRAGEFDMSGALAEDSTARVARVATTLRSLLREIVAVRVISSPLPAAQATAGRLLEFMGMRSDEFAVHSELNPGMSGAENFDPAIRVIGELAGETTAIILVGHKRHITHLPARFRCFDRPRRPVLKGEGLFLDLAHRTASLLSGPSSHQFPECGAE